MTERQSNASRINGRKSKGPVTQAGKAASSGNSLRHGLLARNMVLDEESSARFENLANLFHHQLHPRDFIETTLVDSLVTTRWRQIRLWGAERAAISFEMRKQAEGLAGEQKTTRAALAITALSQGRSLDLFNRYDTRLERQFVRTLERFQTLRARQNVILPYEPDTSSLTGASSPQLNPTKITDYELHPSLETDPQIRPAGTKMIPAKLPMNPKTTRKTRK